MSADQTSSQPQVSDRMRELVDDYAHACYSDGRVFYAKDSRLDTVAARNNLLREIAALEEDHRRLDALDCACRAIDLRFNETPKRCYRWQIDAWGAERVYLRDAIDEQFAASLKEDRPTGMPFTKAELEAIRHVR